MISSLLPLAVGNAVQIVVSPAAVSVRWRVLRKATDNISAFNDPAAVIVSDSSIEDPQTVYDFGADLVNGTPYFYQAFYFDGSTWTTDASASATPQTTYQDDSIDAQTIVIQRVTLGIAAEVARGNLTPPPDTPVIDVLSAPPVFDTTRWPVISVHVDSEAPINRALGESIANDEFNALSGLWDDHEGWHAKTNLSIIGWSLNPDERIAIRKAIRRIILANLGVFDAAGLLQIELTQSDVEDFQTYNAPVYETVGTFACVTPLSINAPAAPISDVQVTVIAETLLT